LTNEADVQFVDVDDNNLTGALTYNFPGGVDGGNNSANWIFSAKPGGNSIYQGNTASRNLPWGGTWLNMSRRQTRK